LVIATRIFRKAFFRSRLRIIAPLLARRISAKMLSIVL
jgi:hypothetical protein